MRHIIPISGKDSLATALVQKELNPKLNYEYIFNTTGFELPEVLAWIDKVEIFLGQDIIKIGANLKEIISIKYNFYLPSQNSRYCTKEAKITPFLEWLGKQDAIVYYGIRADENRIGFNNKHNQNIKPKYPLVEFGFGINQVYQIINHANLKPPIFFWEEMYFLVKNKIGFDPKLILNEYQFDMIFSWRSRANCYLCFNQRYYEWVGLLEHYPELFWESEEYEHKGSNGIFTWNSNQKSLKQIFDERVNIKNKRALEITKMILKAQQLKIFELTNEDDFFDILSIKSCGLFCGK